RFRRRGARRVRDPQPHGGHRSRSRERPRTGFRDQARFRDAALGPGARQPLGPRRQGPRGVREGERELSRIGAAFERARGENRAAFVPFLTAGAPSPDATVSLARTLADCGADVLELGVPFSDPIADGPVLQRSAFRALQAGTSVETVLDVARRIAAETPLAIVLFSYLNPLLRRGVGRLAAEAAGAGVDGILVTDLPPEEAGGVQPVFRR